MSVGYISYFSLKDREYKTLLLRNSGQWDIFFPNNNLSTNISNAMSGVTDEHYGGESRTEIESHAKMVGVGKHAKILADTGNKVYVISLTPEYQDL